MLEQLRIRNYAVAEAVDLELSAGFTTITGETGAGKSILMGALALALGERASADVVRTGADRAMVEAVFRGVSPALMAHLEERGLADGEDGVLILRREVLASGSSRNYLNDRSVTSGQLREAGAFLADLHTQNEHTALFQAAEQLAYLDAFGGYAAELDAYAQAYAGAIAAARDLGELESDAGERERRAAILEFQIGEVREVAPVEGEDEHLEAERRVLANAEALRAKSAAAADLLYEGEQTESPASALLALAGKQLAELAAMDPSLEPMVRQIEEARFAAEDIASRLRSYAEGISAEPGRLEQVDDRVAAIRSLKRKYGGTVEEVLRAAGEWEVELDRLVHHESRLGEAQVKYAAAWRSACAAAARLSARRAAAGDEFAKEVQREMRDLELPKSRFRVHVESRAVAPGEPPPPAEAGAHLGGRGVDRVEFMAALNAGEEERALRKAASGGEMSRILLAIKCVMAGRDPVATLVFDEIDVGISGEAAARVGEKLQRLAGKRQVVAITHLAQMAARGGRHLVVEKNTAAGRTTTQVREVEGEERAEALAQMMAGRRADEAAREFARQLLGQAQAAARGRGAA